MTGRALLHYIKYLLGIDTPDSQTSLKEREVIKKYAANSNTCAEIGVFEGLNTTAIAKAMKPDGILYAIDPFFKGKLGTSYPQKIATHMLKKNNLERKVKIIQKMSFDAGNDVPENVDFIFIDGDHSLEGIEKDWKIFSPKIKLNGIIALHDTSVPEHNPDVAELGSFKYFNSVIKNDQRFEVVETVDSLNVLRRMNK